MHNTKNQYMQRFEELHVKKSAEKYDKNSKQTHKNLFFVITIACKKGVQPDDSKQHSKIYILSGREKIIPIKPSKNNRNNAYKRTTQKKKESP